jgi:AcrR family transcriptional regulator
VPKVSQQYLDERRDDIIDAAAACMARNGIHGTSLNDIRAEAEVSSGALYHYFKTKDEIVAAIRERSYGEDAAAYGEAGDTDSPHEVLTGLLEKGMAMNHGSAANQDARLAVNLWAEALVNPEVLAGQLRLVDLWRQTAHVLLDEAMSRGEVALEVDREAMVEVLTALSFGATVLEAWQPGRMPVSRLMAATRALVSGELRAVHKPKT